MKKIGLFILTASLVVCMLSGCGNDSGSGSSGSSQKPAVSSTGNTSGNESSDEASIELTDMKPMGDFNDGYLSISLYRVKSYDSLKNSKGEEVKPKDGNKFIVAFMGVENLKKDQIGYLIINNLFLSYDGGKQPAETGGDYGKTDNTEQMYADIDSGATVTGFVVFEVPGDKNEFKMTYEGCENSIEIKEADIIKG